MAESTRFLIILAIVLFAMVLMNKRSEPAPSSGKNLDVKEGFEHFENDMSENEDNMEEQDDGESIQEEELMIPEEQVGEEEAVSEQEQEQPVEAPSNIQPAVASGDGYDNPNRENYLLIPADQRDELAKSTCFPANQEGNRLKPNELLPENTEFSDMTPINPELKNKNFLMSSGHHIGVNTVGQSLRNANYQLRSEPANPRMNISPWLNSTIEPDYNRKSLEIGS